MMHNNHCFVKALVDENTHLRQELDHRVRNNLAMIAAILRNEMRLNPEARVSLEVALAKVMTLADEYNQKR